jgi:hypothetical protein
MKNELKTWIFENLEYQKTVRRKVSLSMLARWVSKETGLKVEKDVLLDAMKEHRFYVQRSTEESYFNFYLKTRPRRLSNLEARAMGFSTRNEMKFYRP